MVGPSQMPRNTSHLGNPLLVHEIVQRESRVRARVCARPLCVSFKQLLQDKSEVTLSHFALTLARIGLGSSCLVA